MQYNLVNFCEIDKNAIKSYCAINKQTEEKNLNDISLVSELNHCDLLTYGFPCQDLSVAGNRNGIKKGNRSGLLLEVERILKNTKDKPKFLIMENVKALVEKNNIDKFNLWLKELECLGYNNYYKVLNSKDFGVPQSRNRIFCISVLKEIDNGFNFPEPIESDKTLLDFIDLSVENNLFGIEPQNEHQKWKQQLYLQYIKHSNGICSGVYTNQSKNFGFRPPLQNFAKTLKALVHDCGFVYGDIVRNFTALEYWKLQGFSEEDFNIATSSGCTEAQLKKQAGNSITVNVLSEIYRSLRKTYPNYFKDNISVISLFSGIGAFEKAFEKI